MKPIAIGRGQVQRLPFIQGAGAPGRTRSELEAACARTIRSGDPRLHHVRNVLDRGLEFPDPAAFVPPNTTAATNENVRGPDYFAGEIGVMNTSRVTDTSATSSA